MVLEVLATYERHSIPTIEEKQIEAQKHQVPLLSVPKTSKSFK
jgi:hypothetical protein